jgi:hypothetical protein
MTPASSKASKKTTKPSPGPTKEIKEEHATVPVRVRPTTHQFIIGKANWGESIDSTLRRLLHITEGAVHTASNGR